MFDMVTAVLHSGFEIVYLGDIPGGRPVEQFLHFVFNAYREIGEWFRPEPELEAAIDHLVISFPSLPPYDPASGPAASYLANSPLAPDLSSYGRRCA